MEGGSSVGKNLLEEALTWVEVDGYALQQNVITLKARLPKGSLLAVAVKSNAYGHGLILSAKAFIEGGADWLCVHSIGEARALRQAGITVPIYLFGPCALSSLEEALALQVRLVTYTHEQITCLAEISKGAPKSSIKLHLKVETGNHRQGLKLPELISLVEEIKNYPQFDIEGLSSHFANVEDTTDHRFAETQLERFNQAYQALCDLGIPPKIRHIANSAATILWPERVMDMARVGISAYGLWPSKDTQAVAQQLALMKQLLLAELQPALTWKTRIAQIKSVNAGESIGYGCSFVTTRASRIAVIPVGYFEGYDRSLSNIAYVLVHGQRAPIRGRVCMNMCMIDVTDISEVSLGDEAVLLGRQTGKDGTVCLSAEQLASWANTINYEIIARISPEILRIRLDRANVLS